ncbi:DNRLRE domain-containing protein [Streptomyces sp. CC208A]|uniref:DNRLRE domain-containing protein n=1 Tax=Streptomyces sp. CC208A TaxID=3044573 RepID=UPI0024A829BD|nr:DNRLRE domain-containing protein [Streptomyces sp. CC208A]
MRTRTRLSLTLGLVLAALTAALLPWWQPTNPPTTTGSGAVDAKQASTGPKDEATARAEAVRTGKQVLVETATTATALTWALPDGQLRTRTHALPQRAKNAEGRWAPIDTTLKRSAKAPRGLGVAPVNAAVPLRFSSGDADGARADRSYVRAPQPGETVLAEVEFEGHTIAFTWPGALPEPVLDGPRALYSEVLPGVDLLLVAREEGGFGQLLIVKTPEAAKNPALARIGYGLRSATATFHNDPEANRVLVLNKAGQEVASVPTPFGWDANGRDAELPEGTTPRTSTATPADVLKLSGLSGMEPGAKSAQLPFSLEGDKSGTARISLDVAGTGLLSAKDVAYPVFVDPSINPGTQAWSLVVKNFANSSFYNGTNFNGGTSEARVGHENDTGLTARSFWRMGFDKTIKGATVSKAHFKVLNTHSWSCETREFQFYLTGSISSGTTWNAQPSWSTLVKKWSFAHGYNSSCPDAYESIDVKTAAQKAADNGWPNITFGLRATTETSTYTWRKFKATSAVMEVDYNRKPNEPTNGTSSPGGACVPGPGGGVTIGRTNIVLKVYAKDPDNNLGKVRFRFWKTGGTVPAGTLVTAPASGGYVSLTIPATDPLIKDITTNTTYSWDVRAEDQLNAVSTFFPPGTEPCRITVDPTAPPAPIVDEDTTPFKPATSDGATWAEVKFGQTGPISFSSTGAKKFTYSWGGVGAITINADASGSAKVTALQPPNAGPNTLHLYAFDSVGNRSARTDYTFYVPPKDAADGPGDVGGDGTPDLLVIDASGNLRSYAGQPHGELYGSLAASYRIGTDGKAVLNPKGHWYDAGSSLNNGAALISHYQDTYPGDGTTDLFARTPDGGFWLYPGDGYGSFDVDRRLKVRLPSNAPAPSTWIQLKALGDITGDKLPDVTVRTADGGFWVLSGYTGAGFQSATLMNSNAWARRDIVNLADINKDGTPDLLWRNLDNGNMYLRRGKPGSGTGSVDLESLKLAANAVNGDEVYGGSWTEANVDVAIGIPDINNDGIPDIWARFPSDGHMSIYHPSTTNTNGPVKTVIGSGWQDKKAFG